MFIFLKIWDTKVALVWHNLLKATVQYRAQNYAVNYTWIWTSLLLQKLSHSINTHCGCFVHVLTTLKYQIYNSKCSTMFC